MAIDGAPSARQRRAFGATLGAGVESEAAQDIAAEHSRPSLQARNYPTPQFLKEIDAPWREPRMDERR